MKNNGVIACFLGLFVIGVATIVFGYGQISADVSLKKGDGLVVKIDAAKANYVLGEPVDLAFEVTNNSSSNVELAGSNVESGYLKIFVASTDGRFLQYSNSTWGLGKSPKFSVGPGESLKSGTSVLWNFNPKKRFSDVERLKETHLLTDFAFPHEGSFKVKAILIVPGGVEKRVESEAIQINIDAPGGSDLALWKAMKENPEIAFFIQHGSFSTYDKEVREKLSFEIGQIVREYPSSRVAGILETNLERYRLAEEKRMRVH